MGIGEQKNREKEAERKTLYGMGLVVLALVLAYGIFHKITGYEFTDLGNPCPIYRLTGLYCPGCGGTRAFQALLDGEIGRAFRLHPLVPYGAALYLWFMISNTIEYASRGRLKVGMAYRKWYVKGAIGILAIHVVVKNLL